MGENEQSGKHDNSEYENPTSRTGAQPIPPETFAQSDPDAGGDSDAAFRDDIRSGLSDQEAEQRAQDRAEADRQAAAPAPEEQPPAPAPEEAPVTSEPGQPAPDEEQPAPAPEPPAEGDRPSGSNS